MVFRGHVKNGGIVLDEPLDLPEGTEVEIAAADDDEMSADERAEIESAIDESLQQMSRGEGIPAEEVLRRLRSLG
jgi:hypothetical protein